MVLDLIFEAHFPTQLWNFRLNNLKRYTHTCVCISYIHTHLHDTKTVHLSPQWFCVQWVFLVTRPGSLLVWTGLPPYLCLLYTWQQSWMYVKYFGKNTFFLWLDSFLHPLLLLKHTHPTCSQPWTQGMQQERRPLTSWHPVLLKTVPEAVTWVSQGESIVFLWVFKGRSYIHWINVTPGKLKLYKIKCEIKPRIWYNYKRYFMNTVLTDIFHSF